MYIIDRNTDFYDYLSNVYGVDKGIVFDRRGSVRLTDDWLSSFFSMVSVKYVEKDDQYFILEVGTVQYLIRAYDPKWIKASFDKVSSFKIEIVRVFHNNKHRYGPPISIRNVRLSHVHWWFSIKSKNDTWDHYVQTESYEELFIAPHHRHTSPTKVDLPILAGTKLTSILNPDELWKELMNYISSQGNDKDVSIPMTDVEKVEQHGFDKKTSFRHPVK